MNLIDRFLNLDICSEKIKKEPMNTGLFPLPKIVEVMNGIGKLFLFVSFVVLTSPVDQFLFTIMMIIFFAATTIYLFSLIIKQYINVKRINYLNERRVAVGREKLSILTF